MPTARKTAKPKPAADQPPLLELSTAEPDAADLVLVFKIDGVPYYAPKTGAAWMALEYLEVVDTRGQDAAMVWMFRNLLGEDAYAALRAHKSLSMADLGRLMNICQRLVLGMADEAPKASPRHG